MPERYDINGNPIGFFSIEDEGIRYVDPTVIQPAVVSANRGYWEAQKWARENVRDPRERTAPYVAAGLGATMAAPVAIDLAASGLASAAADPLWKAAAKRMAIDLPAFEAIDRLPQAWGDDRLTTQGTNLIKQTTPIGQFAPWVVDAAGPFIAGMVPGMAGDMMVRGTAAGVNGLLNGMARRTAADRMGYLGPMAEVVGERSARTPTRLGGESQNHIQTLLENGEFNPMDLEVAPAGSGRSGVAPTNLVRNADGSIVRTPDGYVVRRGRDFTVDPNNPQEFFYDNAGRQYESIAEATGSGRSIEAPEWTAEELTNFAADAQNGLSSEEQQALRDLIQQRVNETLDRMGASRRRVSSDPDYDELAAEASGLVRHEPIGNDSYILPDPPEEINIDLNSLTNSAPSGSQAERIVELYEPVTGDAFDVSYSDLLRSPDYLDGQPNYILQEILDELRDQSLAPGLGIGQSDIRSLEQTVAHRLVRNGENSYEQLRHVIQNLDDGELRSLVGVLDSRDLSAIESNYGWDLNALNADGISRTDAALDELTRNARRRLRALSNNRTTPPLSSSRSNNTASATREVANTQDAWLEFDRATRAGDVDGAIESYLQAEGVTDRSEQAKHDAIRNILRRSDLPDAMRDSFVSWFEKEASGLSEKEVLEKYLEDIHNMMSLNVSDIHGNTSWSERSFLDDHRRGFSDEAFRRAEDKLNTILDEVPASDRRNFRLTKEQFDDVYSEFEPLKFSQMENPVRSTRVAGYARYLNGRSDNPGIDFSKFGTPEEFASEVQHGLRENDIVDARTSLPLDIRGLSYRSMGDQRAEWLVQKVYDSFRDPSKPYRGVMMDPYLSRSADSHRMAYTFSARNYGTQPGGVTWKLADWPASSNQLERNSVYINSSGEPVFTNPRVGRLANRAGLNHIFTPEEYTLLKNIASGSEGANNQSAYLKAKELAQFVQDYSTNSLLEPVRQISLLDPSLDVSKMTVTPRTVEFQTGWLREMMYPQPSSYTSQPVGFRADFRFLPPAGILRHKNGGILDRLNKHYNGDRAKIIQAMQYARGGFKRDAATDAGDQYYDIVRQRRNSAFNALLRAGINPNDAARLAPMIVTQQTMEGGWVLNRKDNNYGGMKSAGKTIAFDSEDDFQDAYIKMLDSKWHNGRAVENSWRSARNLDDWARILNREDLGLATKEAWEKYNRGKQGNDFVYLYAPQWENNNKPYREHLKKTEDRTAAYLKMVEADEPLMSLSPRQEERVVRQMPIVPEQPAMPLGMFRTMIPTSVQQKMPATQDAQQRAPTQAPLLRSLIPTSVQKKMNGRADGGLIERYGVDKVRAAMQKVKR